PSIDRSTKP
nr:Chain B, SLP-76 binding peptide [synthetic construct]2D0N_D Chain D, SLP-76 binding peptide [synthetic construct]